MEGGDGSSPQDSPEIPGSESRTVTRPSNRAREGPGDGGAASPGEPTPSTSVNRERPAIGESGAMLDALLSEFESSSNVGGEERGWGEIQS